MGTGLLKRINIELGFILKKTTLVCFILIALSTVSLAEIRTYTYTLKQPFGGSQSPDDARVAAISRAKREVLEKAGTYLETFTIVRENVVDRDEILALAAGVLKAEIVSQKNYATEDAFGILVAAKVDVDTSILEKRVSKLIEEQSLLEKYKKSQRRERELLAKLAEFEDQIRMPHNLSPQEIEKERERLGTLFSELARGLTAVEWYQKAAYLIWNERELVEPELALAYLDKAIDLDPYFANAYSDRGAVYFNHLGQDRRAIENFDKAIRLDPNDGIYYYNRGIAYERLGKYKKAIKDLKKAIQLNPNDQPAYNDLAWVLATCPLESIRNGFGALDLATIVMGLPKRNEACGKDTLAAAYAEIGRFEEAVKIQREAIQLLKKGERCNQENVDELTDYIQRLSLYEQHKPFRDTSRIDHF